VALTLVGSAQAAERTCSAEDLEGARAPALLRDHGLDTQEDPLVVGTRYRVVVVQELAIGDNSQPVDGSIAVAAPNGPPLEASTEDRRPVYDFTPTGPGSVRLVVSWDQEVGSYGSGDVCAASQAFDLPVLAPTAPTLEGVFRRGPRTFESSFLLRLRGEEPQDPAKIDVILRARRGTTRPPAPRGRALATFGFRPTGSGGFETRADDRELRRTFYADTVPAGVRIYPYGNIAFGRTLRFAFSLEVVQGGRRIGGMSSGAKCRRIQFPGHSAVKCRAVGLARHP
jgi:hypothetical protein